MFVSTAVYGILAGPSTPMRVAWCRGVAAGCHCVVASQRPQDPAARAQCEPRRVTSLCHGVAVSWRGVVVAGHCYVVASWLHRVVTVSFVRWHDLDRGDGNVSQRWQQRRRGEGMAMRGVAG
jgi:hypothetical protein